MQNEPQTSCIYCDTGSCLKHNKPQQDTKPQLPEDVMKIFLKAEKYFRQYQNCPPDHHSQKWFSVIASFDEVLGLMDTVGEFVKQESQKDLKQQLHTQREAIIAEVEGMKKQTLYECMGLSKPYKDYPCGHAQPTEYIGQGYNEALDDVLALLQKGKTL